MEGKSEEESLEATLENRHRGCGRDMLGQTVYIIKCNVDQCCTRIYQGTIMSALGNDISVQCHCVYSITSRHKIAGRSHGAITLFTHAPRPNSRTL